MTLTRAMLGVAIATITLDKMTDPVPDPVPNSEQPPRRLTNVVTHRDYHPSYMRVGVRVDGVERNDIHWYDADAGQYSTSGPGKGLQAGQVEPYWRYPETRQQRRARERWERSRGA